ncbi:RagB/SusD family nutrient uptake outer membrane protein [Pedobacter sp. SL55]|uniref:RagB/SusD family nutrient uptake outer membrane protein n=1 Tax=Pedobacter sp. SL55 TaxID=2995161 RepID=UPI0022706906|nr:RagB/SusD family nutrient uptake outer membrane protein [Pedobacter sp. SL55]WAC39920.1 RagB/SusD family nutrient uptake outer membrane protein [Pedobacter sp. SL55]
MKRSKILVWGLLLISLSSCKKFLDVTPSNSADAAKAIQTPRDAQIVMNGLMNQMTSSSYYGRNFIMYAEAKGGDVAVYSQGRGLDALYTFNHNPNTNSYSSFWSQIYYCILQSNYMLEEIAKRETDGVTGFNTAKGQALTARALMYFDLVRLYGKAYTQDKASFGVPIVLTKLGFDAKPLRASVEQVYTQIVKDLTDAAPLLPKTKTNGYINYYANKAILARVYLNMDMKTEALLAAEEVMGATSLYTLYTNANWVDSWKSQYGTESIFELNINPLENDLGTASLGVYQRNRNVGTTSALGFFYASTDFLSSLNAGSNADIRRGVMARDESSATRLGALYKYSGGLPNGNASTSTMPGDKSTGNNTAVNIKVIRLSEMYLIAAEAALISNPTKAVNYLNAIRQRNPGLSAATIGNISLDMILEERRKELYGEGHRFFDMIRSNRSITYNDEFGNLTILPTLRPKTIDRNFYKTILPIPQSEINANPQIKAQQNPSY